MRVLVADRLPELTLAEMRALGVEVSYDPGLGAGDLAASLSGVGVLVVRGTPVTAAAIQSSPSLSLIIRAGAGTSSIDVQAASERGVYVATCPGKNAAGVAELAMTLIGSLDRRVPDAVQSLRGGQWEKDEYAQAVGLRGKRIGILGLGHVGRAVLRLAKAYGLEPHGYSRSLTDHRAKDLGVNRARTILDLARNSDIFTVHLELTPRTEKIVSREVIDALPDGAFLINTARSELVDYDALAELAPKKRLRVGLDVLPDEPDRRTGNYDHPILRSGLVYATPHIGASTDQGQHAIADETVRVLRGFLREGEVPNAVNLCAASPARYQLVVRHLDKLGVLADILGVIKRHGINVEELENTVFDGAKAACAKVLVDSRPSEGCLAEIRAVDEAVLYAEVVSLPNLA